MKLSDMQGIADRATGALADLLQRWSVETTIDGVTERYSESGSAWDVVELVSTGTIAELTQLDDEGKPIASEITISIRRMK